MVSKATQILPLRLLLNAEPFGFGPSAAIAGLFPLLRPHFATMGYIGKKHTLDLQRSLPYDAIHNVTGTFKDKRTETYGAIFSGYDILLTAMDHKVASEARKAGLRVFYYDALTWYWPRIPGSARKSDLYIAQNFFGVHDRLKSEFKTHPAAHSVAPNVSPPPAVSPKDCVLINLGGLQNPHWPIEEVAAYARVIIDAIRQIVPLSEKIMIAASENVARLLDDKEVRTYPRAEMETLLARSKIAFMTPGLGNIYDAAAYNLPTIWLPPANDSQGLQLTLLGSHHMRDAAIHWQNIGQTIDYTLGQPSILAQIARAASYLATQSALKDKLIAQAAQSYHLLSTQRTSKTHQLLQRFGSTGLQETTRLVVERARDFVANECYFSLPGDIKGALRTPYHVTNDPDTQMQIAAHAPGIIFNIPKPKHIDMTLEHVVSRPARLDQNGPRTSLYTVSNGLFPADLCHLLYGIERLELLKRGYFPVHGACVGKDDAYHLIIGHSGVGKSSVAQNLVEKHGFKLFSGNKTVIRFDPEGLRAVAGTRIMTKCDEKGHRHSYHLRDQDYSAAHKVTVSRLTLVRLNDGVAEAEKLMMPSALHTLYPYFMDSVNADVIVNGRDVFDGAASETTKRSLIEKLGQSLPKIPIFRASGSMSFLEGIIQSL